MNMSVSDTQIYAENTGKDAGVSSAAQGAKAPVQAGAAQGGLNSGAAPAGKNSSAKIESSAQQSPAQKGEIKQAAPVQKAVAVQKTQQKEIFPPFDTNYFASHILWLAVCFGFFYFFMARVVLPRIGGVIETRRDRVAADLDQAARMKSEADAAVEAYQKSLSEARDQAKAIASAAAEEARAKADAERKSVESELERKLAESEKHIAAFRDQALAEVHNIAQDIAADIIQKISGKKADKTALVQAVKAAGGAGSAGL